MTITSHPTDPTHPTVRIRAVREYMTWPSTEPDTDPARWTEWVDPERPTDIWSSEPPDDPDYGPGYEATADPADCIEWVGPIYAAAELIHAADDRGVSVWEWDQDPAWETINYRHGVESAVTLFVDGPGAKAALTIADEMIH